MTPSTSKIMTLLLATLVPLSCWASTGPDGGRPPRPPQEAFDACLKKSAGTAVEITTPEGETIKAVCRELGGELVAIPEGAPPPPRGGDCGCHSKAAAGASESK